MQFKQPEKGQVLVLAVIVLGLILANSLILVAKSIIFFQNSRYSTFVVEANSLAEAGIDKAIASLNASGGAYLGEENIPLGSGFFSVSVTSKDGSTKQIEAIGLTGKDGNEVKRTIKVIAGKGLGASFKYGVQVGNGGFEMSNGSVINGSVYSNGNIVMSNNTKITGDAYVAGGVAALADQISECNSPTCSDYIFGKSIAGEDRLNVAQGFKPSISTSLRKIAIKLKKTGSPPDLTVRILKDDNGKPDKNNILASSTLTANLVTSSYSYVEVAFSSPPLVLEDNVYWIGLFANLNDNNYFSWSGDDNRGYLEGSAAWSSNWQANPTWNSLNLDLGFKTYMGGNPTYISGSNGALIDGNAHANTLRDLNIGGDAYYQVMENITANNLYPNSADPSSVADPISEGNISAWKEKAEEFGVYTGDISSCRSVLEPGKYIGNISFSNGCTVTIKDPVWINNGNLSLSNGVTLKLDSSYGVSSGVILVDGQTTLANNIKIKGSGIDGSFLMLLSLYDSRTNSQSAISLSNSGNEGILSAPWGIISVANNNHISEVNAWKVILGTGVVVDYDNGFSSMNFSSGPGGAYSLIKGTYQIK